MVQRNNEEVISQETELQKVDPQPDIWLTKVLKRNVASFLLDTDGGEPVFPKPMKSGFYYTRLPTSADSLVRSLTKLGFAKAVTSVEFVCPTRQLIRAENKTVVIREAKSADREAIGEIAATSFRFSRFHLDPKISKTDADEIKRQWVFNSIDKKRGDHVFVAEWQGQLAGFLSTINKKDETIIDLIAVSDAFRGKGIGRALVGHLAEPIAKSRPRIRVGTQDVNIPSIQLYEKCGFGRVNSHYVLHRHV